MRGKALRRAIQSTDAVRINAPVVLISDSTELITPQLAREMLRRNHHNRPVNWNKVEEFAQIMRSGGWKLHGQGLMLDGSGNILTGQTRLWAVIYADTGVYMRVSRGNPPDTATLIDRGRPQSSRDLASRRTERKHSPSEASIARAICILRGNMRPSTDEVATQIAEKSAVIAAALKETHRTKKSKAVLMVLAAACELAKDKEEAEYLTKHTSEFALKLDEALAPHTAKECWGKGTAFAMALEQARRIVCPT